MINRNITLASLVIALLCAVPAFAQMGMGPGGGMMGGGMMGGGSGYGYDDGYQLTAEQQKAYQEVVGKYRAQFAKLSEQVWNKHTQLNAVLSEDKVDADRARTLAKEIGELSAQRFETRVNMLIDLREKGLSYYGLGMMHGGMRHGGMMGGHGRHGGYGYGGPQQ
jgi:zinc resistance-associated protein